MIVSTAHLPRYWFGWRGASSQANGANSDVVITCGAGLPIDWRKRWWVLANLTCQRTGTTTSGKVTFNQIWEGSSGAGSRHLLERPGADLDAAEVNGVGFPVTDTDNLLLNRVLSESWDGTLTIQIRNLGGSAITYRGGVVLRPALPIEVEQQCP